MACPVCILAGGRDRWAATVEELLEGCSAANAEACSRAPPPVSTFCPPLLEIVRLPATLPLDRAALVEPTAVAVHDVGRAQVRAGERVVVVGGGPIGVLIAPVARAAGAEVRVVELSAPAGSSSRNWD